MDGSKLPAKGRSAAARSPRPPSPEPLARGGVADPYGPIKTRRISEEIGDRIRQQIAARTLRPGDRLPTERELADMFAVSRMAVREGMRNLETAGLITLRKGRHGGALISDASAKLVTQSIRDMIDLGRASLPMLMEARQHVMDVVVRLACARARPGDLEKLESSLAAMEALTRAGRFEERTLAAIGFHRTLAEATGNHILGAIVEGLSEVMRRFVALAGPRPHDPVIGMLRQLVGQIRDRDADAATETMGRYLQGLQKHLIRTKAARRQA